MLFDLVALIVGLAGFAYLVAHARELAAQPRRGTEWRPSYRTYLMLAFVLLVMALGALMSLLNP